MNIRINQPVTASMLYDMVNCPHRVMMDLFADQTERDEVNPFLELLWEKGTAFEKEVISDLDIDYLDLSIYSGNEKEILTKTAMDKGESLIYGGRIRIGDLLGEPDLLRKHENSYMPGDIKSGSGEEGPDENKKPKKHYGVQLALYVDILEKLGLSAGRRGFIWDIRGEETLYDLDAAKGPRTATSLWDDYQSALKSARKIINKTESTLPAYASICKLCHWYTSCRGTMQKKEDLTLIPELGRATRDSMFGAVKSISEFAKVDPKQFIIGKKTAFQGLGPDRLRKFHNRARLIDSNDIPYLKLPVSIPSAALELFFDIEYDPMRDLCYLHGFIERRDSDNASERYVQFFCDEPTPEEEKAQFADALDYIQESQPCIMFYYSKYERTIYRKLREKYPDVVNGDELEAIFDPMRSVDLYYDVILKATEWPTMDYSLKTLAKYLGFSWRDEHPSGAASIEWFHRWVVSGDRTIKHRILEYNEDDCCATRVLLNAIRNLPVVAT